MLLVLVFSRRKQFKPLEVHVHSSALLDVCHISSFKLWLPADSKELTSQSMRYSALDCKFHLSQTWNFLQVKRSVSNEGLSRREGGCLPGNEKHCRYRPCGCSKCRQEQSPEAPLKRRSRGMEDLLIFRSSSSVFQAK